MAAHDIMKRGALLSMYRVLIRNAKVFPSIRRDRLVENIRLEFRENMGETDPEKLRVCYAKATQGCMDLQKYTGFSSRTSEWSVKLAENPMPKSG